jgi:hypothetical protein
MAMDRDLVHICKFGSFVVRITSIGYGEKKEDNAYLELLVPCRATFDMLHRVICIIFNWDPIPTPPYSYEFSIKPRLDADNYAERATEYVFTSKKVADIGMRVLRPDVNGQIPKPWTHFLDAEIRPGVDVIWDWEAHPEFKDEVLLWEFGWKKCEICRAPDRDREPVTVDSAVFSLLSRLQVVNTSLYDIFDWKRDCSLRRK